jgi:hypothetical protein
VPWSIGLAAVAWPAAIPAAARAVALQRCYERREEVIDAFFDLADTIITVRA